MQANAIQMPLKDSCIDCVVTDPPYELGFMGKKWDSSGVAFQVETWKEVLRVMKPGAMMFCFGGTRTHHRVMCAIEDAGFEIRDCLMWLYGSGFPKSHDISKAIDKKLGVERKKGDLRTDGRGKWELKMQREEGDTGIGHADGSKQTYQETLATAPEAQAWDGQGTALKPAWEPIILAMKPLDGTFAQNALKWGVAGLNIDAGRIGTNETVGASGRWGFKPSKGWNANNMPSRTQSTYEHNRGRWPANVILDEEAGAMLDKQSGVLKTWGCPRKQHSSRGLYGMGLNIPDGPSFAGDSGGAARFFYCAKASRAERGKGNFHPTVKPLVLIEYLIKLGSKPGHIVLDCFVGSGTTMLACDKLNRTGIGLDLSFTYLSEIAKPRQDRPLQRVLM